MSSIDQTTVSLYRDTIETVDGRRPDGINRTKFVNQCLMDYFDRVPSIKLSPRERLAILNLYDSGVHRELIAESFLTSPANVNFIFREFTEER